MPPVVAVVGRPNVGKSTLVNRIIGRREAIVEERPGVTRDRKAVDAEWRGRPFVVVDTGGWLERGDTLDADVTQQTDRAIAGADAVLMVVDAVVGATDEDAEVARRLLATDAPVLVAANKVDAAAHEDAVWDFLGLGLGEPHPISALHGRGTGDLLDALVEVLPAEEAEAGPSRDDAALAVAIVGRPNVGKSTLFNRLSGDDRAVVHDRPGTTRDSVDTIVETPEGPIRFVDTAGMRRRARMSEATEYFSSLRALRSVDEADLALLVVDATVGVTHQDQRLAERIAAAGCPAVVLLNKWELLDPETRRDVEAQLGRRLHFLGSAPVLKISALTGRGVHKVLPALSVTAEGYGKRVSTSKVNQVIRKAQVEQPPPGGARVLYGTQGAIDPPTFTLFATRDLPPTYLRYLERRLRDGLGFGSTPLKIRVRRRSA